MLSFDAEVADPCSGGARSPVRGHVPQECGGGGLRASYFPAGETGPGKGHFMSKDCGSDSFKNNSS